MKNFDKQFDSVSLLLDSCVSKKSYEIMFALPCVVGFSQKLIIIFLKIGTASW